MTPNQTWDPEQYARHARFVAELGEPLLGLLEPKPGERILDLGCGDGALTEKLVSHGCRVVGIDSSPEQVAAARRRGLEARVMDATALPFREEFDGVLSNAVLHWIRDADAVLGGVQRALRPGGRLVAELGGAGCVAGIRAALQEALARRGLDADALDPWTFPTAEAYRERLEANGFRVDEIRLFPRPTPLPGDITTWIETFGRPFLAPIPDRERPVFLTEVREILRPTLYDPPTGWKADYVRLRFRSTRK